MLIVSGRDVYPCLERGVVRTSWTRAGDLRGMADEGDTEDSVRTRRTSATRRLRSTDRYFIYRRHLQIAGPRPRPPISKGSAAARRREYP